MFTRGLNAGISDPQDTYKTYLDVSLSHLLAFSIDEGGGFA